MPRFMRPVATHVADPSMRLVSGRLPGFATLTHVGRSSGRVYRTPVNVFFDGERASFALTYGADVHWVQNVVAAGGCTIETEGRDMALTEPEVIVDASRKLVPTPVRVILRLIRADEFLTMRVV